MTKMLDTRAYNPLQAITIVRELHPGCLIDAWEDNNGYDVLVWRSLAEARNDDGAKAIARYTIPKGTE